MEKVLLFSCYFEPIDTARGFVVYQSFKDKYDTKLVYSSYSHIHKEYVVHENKDFIPVRCIPYKKNLSLSRIFSYFDFAFKSRKIISRYNPSVLYVQVPPNSVAYFAVKQAKKRNIPVIVDILDLWPESLPVGNAAKTIIGKTVGGLWSYWRSYAIKNADIIMSESKYFLDQLNCDGGNTRVVHLTKVKNSGHLDNEAFTMDKIVIAFLGSINSISDFDGLIKLAGLLKEKGRQVELSIIGDGVNCNNLLHRLTEQRIPYVYHGKIFDDAKKHDILKTAWFGFNGYKSNTEVALSYKSIDYLSCGLPLISNVKGDTWDIVEKHKIGYNYTGQNMESIAGKINSLTYKDIADLKSSSYAVFTSYFSYEIFEKKMNEIRETINAGVTNEKMLI